MGDVDCTRYFDDGSGHLLIGTLSKKESYVITGCPEITAQKQIEQLFPDNFLENLKIWEERNACPFGGRIIFGLTFFGTGCIIVISN